MTRIQEINSKEGRLRDLMEALDLDAVLLKSQRNFCWFTAGGLNVVSLNDAKGVSSILVTKDSRFVVCDNIEEPRMKEEEDLRSFGFEFEIYDWFDGDERSIIAGIVDADRIGCDVPGAGYRFIEPEIQAKRYQLLDPEVERYLWLGRKASEGLEKALTLLRPGMTEASMIGVLSAILWEDRIDSICWQAAGDERAYTYRHAIPTEKKIERYLVMNVNARKWGLVTTITRSAHIGAVSTSLKKQYEDNCRIECEMIAATRPGVPVKDIFAKACGLYEKLGYKGEWRRHHQGGAQGYNNRDYLVKSSSTELVLDRQCFCWNPSIAGTKSEDAFVVKGTTPLMITIPVTYPTIQIEAGGVHFVRPTILELC
jgi:Xaa-Pro dipeptidase